MPCRNLLTTIGADDLLRLRLELWKKGYTINSASLCFGRRKDSLRGWFYDARRKIRRDGHACVLKSTLKRVQALRPNPDVMYVTPEIVADWQRELRRKGCSWGAVADELGLARQTVMSRIQHIRVYIRTGARPPLLSRRFEQAVRDAKPRPTVQESRPPREPPPGAEFSRIGPPEAAWIRLQSSIRQWSLSDLSEAHGRKRSYLRTRLSEAGRKNARIPSEIIRTLLRT